MNECIIPNNFSQRVEIARNEEQDIKPIYQTRDEVRKLHLSVERTKLNLLDCIHHGFLKSGSNALFMSWRVADQNFLFYLGITQSGKISFENHIFESPSAAAIFVKRLVRPEQRKVDAYKVIKCVESGESLFEIKRKLLNSFRASSLKPMAIGE